MNCQCTTAVFTVSHQTRGFCDLWLTRPRDSTLYAMSVRRLAPLLQAASAQALAGLHLPYANGYHRWAYSAPDPMLVYP